MKAVFLKPYGPFKVGQIIELPPLTFEKLRGKEIVEKFRESEIQIQSLEYSEKKPKEEKKIKKRKDRMIKKPLVEK